MRYRFIDAHKKAWPVNLMCDVLEVSRSGFYHWTSRGPSRRARSKQETGSANSEIFGPPPAMLWRAADYGRAAR